MIGQKRHELVDVAAIGGKRVLGRAPLRLEIGEPGRNGLCGLRRGVKEIEIG
jgi:hypothetical protein